MQDNRRHKRFKLSLTEVHGKMVLAHKVDIIDISLGGVALKADRRLNIGNEYMITLGDGGKSIVVRSVVVRSALSGFEDNEKGERVPLYTAGMLFKEGSADKIGVFLKTISHDLKEDIPTMVNRRMEVRFQIMTPGEQVLSFPSQFTVKDISLSGMLMRTQQNLEIGSIIPMGLSLNADNHVEFHGRIASCRLTEENDESYFEIGVEFTDLKEQYRALISAFVDYLVALEVNNSGKKHGTA